MAKTKRIEKDRTKLPIVKARLESVPARYRAGYLKAVLGKATPKEVIHAMCYACMGYEGCPEEVFKCTSQACPLWAYRPQPGTVALGVGRHETGKTEAIVA